MSVKRRHRKATISEAYQPFQLRLKDEPYWMLVASIFANKTNWTFAEMQFWAFKERYETPEAVAAEKTEIIESFFYNIGMHRIRAIRVKRFSEAWVKKPPKTRRDVQVMPGMGKYAGDAYAIFVQKNEKVRPRDRILRAYMLVGRPGLL